MSMLDDELILAIALDPSDNSLRELYADRLLSRGSAWGELIRLQLMAKKNVAQVNREHELLGLAEGYLPDTMRHAIVRGSSRWERGFMVGCSVAGSAVGAALFHPLWNLVRALHGAPVELLSSCPNLEQWTGVGPVENPPALGGLKVLGLRELRANATWLESLRLEELRVGEQTQYSWYPRDCCEGGGWPPYQPSEWRDFAWLSRASVRMTTFRLHGGAVELDPWLERLNGNRLGFSRLALRSGGESGWELELEQTSPGHFDRAALRLWSHARPVTKCERMEDLQLMLKHLPERRFTHLTLHGGKWTGVRRLPCFAGAQLVRSED